jgi:hypothetical protein
MAGIIQTETITFHVCGTVFVVSTQNNWIVSKTTCRQWMFAFLSPAFFQHICGTLFVYYAQNNWLISKIDNPGFDDCSFASDSNISETPAISVSLLKSAVSTARLICEPKRL